MGETVAVIPARGGSVGVPRKNLLRVGGVPLVARTVHAAANTAGVDRVVVTTDDDEIAAVASEWGAEIVRRPAELSGGTASSESAVLHALDALEARGVDIEVVAFLQPTSPFLPTEQLASAIDRVSAGAADCAFSARESYEFFWAKEGGQARAVAHDQYRRPRRQERDPMYVETGAFYVFEAEGFRAAGYRFFGRIEIAEVPDHLSIEIDAPIELRMARALAPLHVDGLGEAIDVDAVVTDFDGVHTDDTASVTADGTEFVTVSRSDGMGIRMLREAGVPVLILSTETNRVVTARARKLGVEVVQASHDKRSALAAWAERTGVALSRIAYVGNDVNDLGAMRSVAWPVAVAGAHPLAIEEARVVLTRRGGEGAVRELAERVLAARTGTRTTNEEERV